MFLFLHGIIFFIKFVCQAENKLSTSTLYLDKIMVEMKRRFD